MAYAVSAAAHYADPEPEGMEERVIHESARPRVEPGPLASEAMCYHTAIYVGRKLVVISTIQLLVS